MSGPFGAWSTTDDVLEGLNLAGRRILVTGVTAGIGVETARALVAHGAHVTGTYRDLQKAREATAAFSVGGSAGSFDLMPLDLADLASVRACTDTVLARGEPIDIIIANAAIMAPPFGLTADGFELQFGTNHLGHFVLINRIAPLLRTGSRVVMVASAGHRFSDVDLDDPGFDRTDYTPFAGYGRSKTANILFAVEFDQRHRDAGIRAAAVHPGVIQTELARHLPADIRAQAAAAAKDATPGDPSQEFVHKSVPQGAATSVWAAVTASADEIGGRYCEDCAVAEVAADDANGRRGVRPYAVDPDRAAALWALSERMIGEPFA